MPVTRSTSGRSQPPSTSPEGGHPIEPAEEQDQSQPPRTSPGGGLPLELVETENRTQASSSRSQPPLTSPGGGLTSEPVKKQNPSGRSQPPSIQTEGGSNTESTETTTESQSSESTDSATDATKSASSSKTLTPSPSPIEKSSKKKSKIAKLKKELIRLQMELAAARIESIEAGNSEDEDSNSDIESVLSVSKINNWIDKQTTTANDARPPIEERVDIEQTEPSIVTQKPQERSTINIPKRKLIEKPQERNIVTSQERNIVTSQERNIVTSQERNIAASQERKSDIADLAAAIAMAVRSNQAKQPTELPFFNGAFQEWLTFKATFDETSHSCSEIENVCRLRRCLKGKAREAVERMLYTSTSHHDIMKTLETRFGRPDSIAIAEIEQLRSLPKLTENPRDVCIFANKVSNIVSALQALNREYYLYNPEVTKTTIEKLSPTLRHEWYKYATEQKNNIPDLLKLSRFLEQEAEYASPYATPENTEQAYPSQNRKQRTYASFNKEAETCPLCNINGHTKATECKKFKEADSNSRWELAKKNQLCFRCLATRTKKHSCQRKTCAVNNCEKSHHSLLHFERTETKDTPTTEAINSTWCPKSTQTYLKIIPVTVSGPEGEMKIHALLDDGSTVTLIDSEVASKVGAKGRVDPLHIEAITDKSLTANQSRRVSLSLKGNAKKIPITARTMSDLRLSLQKIEKQDIESCPHLEDIKDQLLYEPVRPTMLIGQDNWNLLLSSETRKGNRNQPVASLTPLGWVLHGTHSRTTGKQIDYVNHTITTEEKIEENLRKFFAIESLTITPKLPQSDPEEKAMKILKEKTRKIENQYEAPLLWKNEDSKMPYNYDQAINRLHSIEKKIDKNPIMKEKYEYQMEALITKGYAERAPPTKTEGRTWYLPHFGVINPMKPEKLRIVHDAAAVTRGVSLNNQLLTGPDLLKSLPGVLMRFRQHPVAVCGDIAEMFMQVKTKPEDRDALRYLWRGERREGPPDEYRMTSLIFGATCSPSIAIYVKNINAEQYKDKYPRAVTAIVNNHYVDDYLDSFPTIEEAIQVSKQVRNIHRGAHYELRQWCSNEKTVLEALTATDSSTQHGTVDLNNSIIEERVLGLIWKPSSDELTFNLNLSRLPQSLLTSNQVPTKREVLKIMMSLYDPLGLASPVVIKSKQIMQEIWRRGSQWDEPIDEDLGKRWVTWLQHLRALSQVPIPRAYLHYTDAASLQLHVFTDASETAYAASVYWRAQTTDGKVYLSLITAKAKVAPLKLMSIPRLELQAAVMGSRIATAVLEEHDRKPENVTYWTDSKTVLTWLRNGTRSYKPFVAHRIAAIEENTSIKDWRYIPTKMNVADDATREVPQSFDQHHRWFQGPSFLRDDPSTWPYEKIITIENTGEEKVNTVKERKNNLLQCLPDSERFSKWERLVRSTARVLQFISLCRKKKEQINYRRTKKNPSTDPDWRRDKGKKTQIKITKQVPTVTSNFIPIEASILKRAEELLIKGSQVQSFKKEIEDLNNNRPIEKSSRLRPLSVTLINGILKLKSRIDNAEKISEKQKNPSIIDGDNKITQLWIEYTHRQLHHAGTETTINECRQHYWVLRLRPTTKKIIHRCLPCRIRSLKPTEPQTGNHPHCRLGHHERPFTFTGVDYFGPISVTVGRRHEKRYVALFTCLTTRAVHLEVADSLSTDSAVMALKRLIARRGQPTEIWSDNGTNLRGADSELKALVNLQGEANCQGIKWRFIPPGAPFMGGAWERLVRSVKTAMKAVLTDRHPSDEVLRTVVAEAEYTVNSRPLTHVSVNPEDPEALTPNHFLLGGSVRVAPTGEFDENELLGRETWKRSQKLADHFWRRWLQEYLPELQNRKQPYSQGPPIREGDVVLIADNNLPRNLWPRGVVSATYPGVDGVVRAVDVKTKGGVLRRATKKLVVLPVN